MEWVCCGVFSRDTHTKITYWFLLALNVNSIRNQSGLTATMASLRVNCHSHSGERHLAAGGGATPWDLTKWHLQRQRHTHTHTGVSLRHAIICYKAPNWPAWLCVNTNWVRGSSCCYRHFSQRWRRAEEKRKRKGESLCVRGIKNLVSRCAVSRADSQLPVWEAGALPCLSVRARLVFKRDWTMPLPVCVLLTSWETMVKLLSHNRCHISAFGSFCFLGLFSLFSFPFTEETVCTIVEFWVSTYRLSWANCPDILSAT